MSFRKEHTTTEDGIETISYYPDNARYKTPIVFQHGAWHGAWCWEIWQELFAEWGWESHAHSLPAHGGSNTGRPMRLNTIQHYRDHLKKAVQRCETKPVVIGHSMGGIILQWYLKDTDDLPAAVLLASMPLYDYPWRYFFLDPVSMILGGLTFSGAPFVRSPQHVKRLFLSDDALMTPEDLHSKLDSESLLVPLQLSPLTWHPRRNIQTPMLVMAAENDTFFSIKDEQRIANFYGADFQIIKNTAHNLMIEKTYRESAENIHNWLIRQEIA